MTLANRLAELRKEKGLTQQQLGEKLNITAQAISKWENGLAEPDLTMLKTLAELYNISIAELLAEDEPQQAQTAVAQTGTEAMIGTCTVCGIVVTEENVGSRSPRVMCKTCLAKAKAEEEAKKRREKELAQKAAEKKKRERAIAIGEERRKRKRGLIVGALVAAVLLVIMIAVTVSGWSEWSVSGRVVGCILCVVLPYLGLTLTACMFFDGPALYAVAWGFVHSVKWPGIIFSFDLGGFIFFVVIKAIFAVLSFFIGILTAMIGIAIGAVISLFQFPIYYSRSVESTIKEK